MSEYEAELEQVARAANELVPELTQRLRRQHLGELEVRLGDLRVRVAATPDATQPAPGGPRVVTSSISGSVSPRTDAPSGGDGAAASGLHAVTSPAVGFFAYADGLGPGLGVEKGDALGHVEMLGVRHDVRAPRSGTVRNLVTEAGEPVEYGQLLIELEGAS
ncbi:MAG TPA: biotin/lipoyl-containing protein [Candidatus Limnocylindria bacterium]|jgi:acetyl-CoA carboxylase biotin carboxyl carrier protein|nr:biotin/lipoyl-containing protein [Candidatus Limnocylindria bacterium]